MKLKSSYETTQLCLETVRMYIRTYIHLADRANTSQSLLFSPSARDVARLRKSVISTMRSFTVAPVAFHRSVHTVQQRAFILGTGAPRSILAKINTVPR